MSLNEKIFIFINQKISHPFLDFFVFFVLIPLAFLLVLIPFLMIFSPKNKSLGFFSLLAGALNYLLGTILKNFFKFPRPYEISYLETIIRGPWHAGLYSFPSSTTMLVFGLSFPFLLRKSKFAFIFLLISSLVGFSVIYTGFHFPLDVIAGILFSFVFTLFLNLLLITIDRKSSISKTSCPGSNAHNREENEKDVVAKIDPKNSN